MVPLTELAMSPTGPVPSDSARITLPDVSPIVGARSEMHASHAAISDHSRCSST